MPIKVPCPDCGKVLNAPDSLAGRKAKCPSCGGIVAIPTIVVHAEEDLEFVDDEPTAAATATATAVTQPANPASAESKACPACGETIKAAALLCRFCGEDLGAGVARGQGMWRDGNQMVMHVEAKLPNRCVKTNEPTERRLRRQLYWHHPLLYFMILFPGLIFYVIVALIVRKSADIRIGLSDAGFARRYWGIGIGWLSFFLGGFMVTLGISLAKPDNNAWVLSVIGIFGGLIGIIVGVSMAQVVSAARITDTHLWLKGVHPEYLAGLPAWSERNR